MAAGEQRSAGDTSAPHEPPTCSGHFDPRPSHFTFLPLCSGNASVPQSGIAAKPRGARPQTEVLAARPGSATNVCRRPTGSLSHIASSREAFHQP